MIRLTMLPTAMIALLRATEPASDEPPAPLSPAGPPGAAVAGSVAEVDRLRQPAGRSSVTQGMRTVGCSAGSTGAVGNCGSSTVASASWERSRQSAVPVIAGNPIGSEVCRSPPIGWRSHGRYCILPARHRPDRHR